MGFSWLPDGEIVRSTDSLLIRGRMVECDEDGIGDVGRAIGDDVVYFSFFFPFHFFNSAHRSCLAGV